MNSVELVKSICKERKIPISKLEKDCGFGNGYIRKLKEGKFPSNRIQAIADYLGVSVDYLMTGKEKAASPNEKEAELLVKIRHDADLSSALEKYFSLDDKKKAHVLELIDLLYEK